MKKIPADCSAGIVLHYLRGGKMEKREVEHTQYREFLCAKDAEEWAHTHFSDVLNLPKHSFTY